MPWEKYRIKPVHKTLKAKIYLEYKGENNVSIPYEREQDVIIGYYALVKDYNYGAILIVVIGILLFWWISQARRRDKRMEKLEDEVEYLEEEIDELEKGKRMAKKALEKKALSKNHAHANQDSESKIKSPIKTRATKRKSDNS